MTHTAALLAILSVTDSHEWIGVGIMCAAFLTLFAWHWRALVENRSLRKKLRKLTQGLGIAFVLSIAFAVGVFA